MKKILKEELSPFDGVLLTEEEYKQVCINEKILCELKGRIKNVLRQENLDDNNSKTETNNSPDIVEW